MANVAAKGSFRENTKMKSQTSPRLIGSITTQQGVNVPAGTKLFLSIWPAKGQDNSKYWNVNVTFPDNPQPSNGGYQQPQQGGYQTPAPQQQFHDDEIPF